MRSAPVWSLAVAILSLSLAGCAELTPATATGHAAPPAAGPSSAPAAGAPTRASLTREGQKVGTMHIRNLTEGVIVSLSVVRDGEAGPNLLALRAGIPAGGTYPLPAAPGPYRFRAELQAPNVFTRGHVVERSVIVPRFPPNPPPRLQVTLR